MATSQNNPFDQFDSQSGGNAFDQFDTPAKEEPVSTKGREQTVMDSMPSFLRAAGGLGEAALSAASGTVGTVAGGLAGIGATIAGAEMPGDVVRKVQGAMTYEPRTEQGKTATEIANLPGELYGKAVHGIGDVVRGKDIGGARDLAATGFEIAADAAPLAVGAYKLGRNQAVQGAKPNMTIPERTLQRVQDLGVKIDPEELTKKGIVSDPKIGNKASLANAEAAKRAVWKDLGLPEGTPLTKDTFENYRSQYGQPYRDVSRIGNDFRVTGNIGNVVQNLFPKGRTAGSAASLKNAEIDKLQGDLENIVHQGTIDPQSAVTFWRDWRGKASELKVKGEYEAAAKYEEASRAMHDLMEKNLQKMGKGDLADSLKKSRVQIAKSYAAQDALVADDTINPQIWRRVQTQADQDSKYGLSGNMKDIAKAAQQFPSSFKNPTTVRGESMTGWEMARGAWGLARGLKGDIGGATLAAQELAKPVARSYKLSEGYQRGLLQAPQTMGSAGGIYSLAGAQVRPDEDETASR